CNCSGDGFSVAGSRCRTTPMRRLPRTASWTAATEVSRPTLIGITSPGNSTRLRVGRMISASSGIGGKGRSASARGCSARASALAVFACSISMLKVFVSVSNLAQHHAQAAVLERVLFDLETALRQVDPALEASVRNLEAAYQRADRQMHGPLADDRQCSV